MGDRDDELPVSDNESGDDRLEAMLSVSSTAPPTLDARVRARRLADDRVILPVPPSESPGALPTRRRRFAIAAAVVAAALIGILIARALTPSRDDARSREGRLALEDSSRAARADTARDSAGIAGTTRPIPDSGGRDRSRQRDDRSAFKPAPSGERRLFNASRTEWDAVLVDSAVAYASPRPTTAITIVYPGGSAAMEALARRFESTIRQRGISASRVTVRAADADLPPRGVSITVTERQSPR